MCDSVLTPSQHRAQQNTTAPAYDVPTRAGTFSIPREYVDGGNVERLAILLEEAVRDTIASDLFLRRVDRELHIEQPETRELLKHLHEQLMSLENDDRNRVWARYIKNSFAPVFKAQAPFDFIAGNPPWVNWESLAEEYRNATKQLWADYGFFTQRGYRAVVAGGPGDHHRGPHPSFFCLGGDFPRSFLYHMQA